MTLGGNPRVGLGESPRRGPRLGDFPMCAEIKRKCILPIDTPLFLIYS